MGSDSLPQNATGLFCILLAAHPAGRRLQGLSNVEALCVQCFAVRGDLPASVARRAAVVCTAALLAVWKGIAMAPRGSVIRDLQPLKGPGLPDAGFVGLLNVCCLLSVHPMVSIFQKAARPHRSCRHVTKRLMVPSPAFCCKS